MRGYTLVELLVAVSIFALVMLTATAAYLSFINYNRVAQTSSSVINSLSFTIDTMAREIRTGTEFTCLGSCSLSGVSRLTFTSADGCTVSYRQSGTSILRSESGSSPCTNTGEVTVTDSTITVNSLLFYVRGTTASADPQHQPMVTIVVSGDAIVPNSTIHVPFQIQTGATMRIPDL
jgi:prepilin-type N-terminal cleavage/methylation domain-containing protein